jgi:hypothetical protein
MIDIAVIAETNPFCRRLTQKNADRGLKAKS